VTRELLDLLPVPAERDLPPGRLEARSAALVAAIEAESAPSRLRGWLTSLGLFLAAVIAVCAVLLAVGVRPPEPQAGAKSVVVLAGGSALVALAVVAPRPPRLAYS